jgi:hypothetical protein
LRKKPQQNKTANGQKTKGSKMTIETAKNTADKNQETETETLTDVEIKALRSCETTIRNAQRAFYNMGRALATIRNDRLYRATHSTFDKYAAERWDMTRQRVAQLIASWRIHEQLKAYGFKVLPQTESQCRPFSKIPEDMGYDAAVIAIWVEVDSAVSAGERLTAKLVLTIVDEYLGIEAKPGAAAGDAAGETAGAAAGAAGDADGESASAELREEIRGLKAKIAYLESALAAEKQAHKRTKQQRGGSLPTSKLAKDLFKAGYRAMAKKHHPDHGGNAETMTELNELKETLSI